MYNYIMFSIFNYIEFLSLFFLTLETFRFKIKYYKIELFIAPIILTIISFVSVIYDIGSIFLPIQIFVMFLIVRFMFVVQRMKWRSLYSFTVTIVSYIIGMAVQLSIGGLCLLFELQTVEQLSQPYTNVANTMHILTAIVLFSIGLFINMNRDEGFTFTFQHMKKSKNYMILFSVSITLIFGCFYLFTVKETVVTYILLFIVVSLFTLVYLIISNIQEDFEYRKKSL